MFGNRMITSATPERVYVLCREVLEKPVNENELKSLLEPDNLGGTTPYFGSVKNAAQQLGLISTLNDKIVLAVEKSNVENMVSMRRYINKHIENLKDSMFYKVTKYFMNMGTDALKYKNVTDLTFIGGELDLNINVDDLRAWRFWMVFLGFGYLHDMNMLPNAYKFLEDVILQSELKKGEEYTISEFVEMLQPNINIVINEEIKNKQFNYAVSNAIRTLHDLQIINVKHKPDAMDIWSLYHFEGHALSETITHIVIGG